MSQNKDFILGLTNFNPSIFDAILVILIFCDGIANSCLCVNWLLFSLSTPGLNRFHEVSAYMYQAEFSDAHVKYCL